MTNSNRQQLGATIPRNLYLRLKHRALDEGVSVGKLLEKALLLYLVTAENAAAPAKPSDLVEFFKKSPLYGLPLALTRDPDTGRELDVFENS